MIVWLAKSLTERHPDGILEPEIGRKRQDEKVN
jgi:hypothetical protein